ncbi:MULTISPECIES: DUF2637 domain-containing protein [Nocardia]|uniref:RNA polymerase sigma-70 region 4 domain-containing protein n=1 Tax=Nocardia asteroides NBRC 15531 TaxID=1110697 RepID=U5EE00_NOCAS|nr:MULTISPECIES: DUF2637 domain-containing protein [Nocardia]TLF67662.1 DUF2637 domain-containing protein [Nocardia asteroides NBRC 15531]GAD83434.1 hypothetical protein NCAST_19_01360 [Nocardia asteroides NBRC 15531]SFN83069.1 Homeodomain-like domain-containing protein [Nocardia asteroides]VEG36380.1 Protein of uncharacterised function (DUF2637) [Nocardia asteroides]
MQPTSPSSACNQPPTTDDVRTERAHVFFWTELCIAAGVSVIGNATQAVLHTTALPLLAATVAVIPPLALLAAVHGVALLARADTVSLTARRAATALTVVIAGGAFWLSFTALRALAITAGVPAGEAWLWPLIVEGSMTQSSLALLILAHAHHPNTDIDATSQTPARIPALEPLPTETVRAALPASPPEPCEPVEEPLDDRISSDIDLEALAMSICDQDPGGRRDRATVFAVLSHRYLDGWSAAHIARELGRSRSAVSRILRDAERLHASAATDRAHADNAPPADRAHTGPTVRT